MKRIKFVHGIAGKKNQVINVNFDKNLMMITFSIVGAKFLGQTM